MQPTPRRPDPRSFAFAVALVALLAAGAGPVRAASAAARAPGGPTARFGAAPKPGTRPAPVPVPASLPPAPDLSGVPARFGRLPVRFRPPGNLPLHVQVAADAAFERLEVDLRVDAGDEVRIPQLADGAWHLRVRAVGPGGLEGPDARRDFQLLARPESPFLLEPAADAKLPVGDVTLRWTHNSDAANYVVEVARDTRFAQLAWRDATLRAEHALFHPVDTDYGAADGVYWWHVRSVDAGGRAGAWSDTQALVLRPVPRAPLGSASPDGSGVELSWGGPPEDRVEVELARDAAFRQVVARGEFTGPAGKLPRQPAGTCWARYRVVEPDGFKSAWSGAAKIDVEGSWHRSWRALLPDG
jgi:hypothetical protein